MDKLVSDEDLIRLYRGLKPDARVNVNKGHVEGLRRILDEGFTIGYVEASEKYEVQEQEEDDTIIEERRANHGVAIGKFRDESGYIARDVNSLKNLTYTAVSNTSTGVPIWANIPPSLQKWIGNP